MKHSVLGLVVLLLATVVYGDDDRTTADQVVDRPTLKSFVIGARDEFAAITSVDQGALLRSRLKREGPLKSGDMYLIMFLPAGIPFIHGGNTDAERKNLIDVEDDNGKKVVQEIVAAAQRGGDFVDYHLGEPKYAYSAGYTSGITGRYFVVVGGYHQDVSHMPDRPTPPLPTPAVSAGEVVGRNTLITFVDEAARIYRDAVQRQGYSAVVGIRNAFRTPGSDWYSGSVYLWIVSGSGVILFHATRPDVEGTPTDMTRIDVNGVKFAEELIGGARREGRKFLRYYYDDPTVEGDEDTGSPKLGYAVSFTVANSTQRAVIGSGIYLPTQPGPSSICIDEQTQLCFHQDTFRVSTSYETDAPASPTELGGVSDDSGLFTFFHHDNWEVLVKVLNGCAINDHWWVYSAAATDVGYQFTVETDDGFMKTYRSAGGSPSRAQADIGAFPCTDIPPPEADMPRLSVPLRTASAHHLQHARVTATYTHEDGSVHPATAIIPAGHQAADSGLFTFFDHGNWEVLTKVLDGCAINGHYWVAIASATDVAHEVVVQFNDGSRIPYSITQGLDPAMLDTTALRCAP